MPRFAKDGKPCYIPSDHKCFHGKCLTNREYNRKISAYPDFVKVLLRIKSGSFEDKDPTPVSGQSDVYVVVKYVSIGHPSIRAGQVICQTPIAFDDNWPHWHDHFCYLPPMNQNSVLEFTAYDSDAPAKPEFLGSAKISLDTILDAGNNFKLQLRNERGKALFGSRIDVQAALKR